MKAKVWATRNNYGDYDIWHMKPTYTGQQWEGLREVFFWDSLSSFIVETHLGIKLPKGPKGIIHGELEVNFKHIKEPQK